MVDFNVFDSILDAVFVVMGDGKIVYCNDPAATLCQTSARRVIGKVLISDLITSATPGILPFNEESQGRTSPSPYLETEIGFTKDGSVGKVQLAVRPLDEEHWAFFLRDVTLEEALHSKYRSELAQKEDYARNLEKLVEARTAELRSVNQTLNAILDSLGQGFFTFNNYGDTGEVFTKACEDILEGTPKSRKAWVVLGVPEGELKQFQMWTDSLFKELLPFEDLKSLGPSNYPHSKGKFIVLDYYPIRREGSSISDVVVVATDKTAEHEAQKALEAERQFAAMIVKYTKNKDQFLQFLASVRQSIDRLTTLAHQPWTSASAGESFRILHTLEGEAGTFSLNDLRHLSREPQNILHTSKEGLTAEALSAYSQSLENLRLGFEKFLNDQRDLIKIPQGEISRTLEVQQASVTKFLDEVKRLPSSAKVYEGGLDLFLREPIENRLRYYDGLVHSVAEKLGKKVHPIRIHGGEIRIFPEAYERFFSSLVHAFRNAVDHGLESPEEREWGGKDPAGLISVDVTSSAKGIHLEISDDGKGIDPAVIRKKLAEKFPDKDFSKATDEEVIQEVCNPGFSSRDSVGEFSGRGVGLDALKEEVLRIGGTLRLESKVNQGTKIEIDLPNLSGDSAMLRSA
jgi:two-component system chemotaxis sensor kinase CheA